MATDPTHRQRLLTLLCGQQEINTFLATIDQVLLTYLEYNETLAILSLVFILEFHSESHEWCLFHSQSYQTVLRLCARITHVLTCYRPSAYRSRRVPYLLPDSAFMCTTGPSLPDYTARAPPSVTISVLNRCSSQCHMVNTRLGRQLSHTHMTWNHSAYSCHKLTICHPITKISSDY